MGKILNNLSTIILVFLVATCAGRFGYQVYSKGEARLTETTVIKIEQAPKPIPKIDTLPLENGSNIVVEIVNDKKLVTMTLEDLEYINKKRSRLKKIVEGVRALFARLEDIK